MDYKQQQYPNKLKAIRRKAHYTQERVATLLGHNNTVTISAWETGKAMPSGTNLMKLCILYEKLPQELYPDHYNRIQQYFRFI
ncbi:helix-turn-helix transcriptional regulator [Mucilaginibacter gossypii]|uniref:helix-turn-helix domain-containing protein n=1 Tax=Mucilaginibacter gossypii TaxID=551996 RepID=UPI001676AF0A|nr:MULTISPECIES: helix-turn-helix transcriptional regulator [Mucilaginibacter]QTE35875.1 helix-turn-helix transcriptional regulator [Mucilaginibacter gossypii]